MGNVFHAFLLNGSYEPIYYYLALLTITTTAIVFSTYDN